MMPRTASIAAAMLAGVLAVAAVVVLAPVGRQVDSSSRTDRGDLATVAAGRALYDTYCAACHGAHLEGQPNWQTVGPDGKVLAPPHDATGHTWQHTDDELFRLTKFSVKDVAPEGYVSDMPAFAGTLSDEQIWAVLAFIKSSWPPDIRAYQAMITNPTAAQASALGSDWRFPPLCKEPSRALAAARQRAVKGESAASVSR